MLSEENSHFAEFKSKRRILVFLDSEPLNTDRINAIKEQAYQDGYEPIKNYGKIKTNQEYLDSLDDIKHDEP